MKKTIAVTIYVDVTVDETKFTPEWMQEFRDGFYKFQSLDRHVEHLAQLNARGIVDAGPYDREAFIEGYGPAKGLGIVLELCEIETEVV